VTYRHTDTDTERHNRPVCGNNTMRLAASQQTDRQVYMS